MDPTPSMLASALFFEAAREIDPARRVLLTFRGHLASAASRPDDDMVYFYVGRDWRREGVSEPGAVTLGDLRAFVNTLP